MFRHCGMVAGIASFVLLFVASKAWGQATLTLTTPGEGSVTVPTGVDWTDVTVQCWGGGGGGGLLIGGGGGAYSANTYATPLVAGTYSYYVGAGGTGGEGGNPSSVYEWNGSAGGNTIWNYGGAEDVIAGGGGGGLQAPTAGGPPVVGSGGLVLAGEGYSGGDGGGYSGQGSVCGGGGGGSGGPGEAGGEGGIGTTSGPGGGGTGYGNGGNGGGGFIVGLPQGYDGSFPGGAGGGGSTVEGGNFNYASGQGANGEIIISYTQEAVPEPSTLTLFGSALLGLGVVYLRRGKAKADQTESPLVSYERIRTN